MINEQCKMCIRCYSREDSTYTPVKLIQSVFNSVLCLTPCNIVYMGFCIYKHSTMIMITTITQPYAVLPLTFTHTTGIQDCELWQESGAPYQTAIGVKHCPPVNAVYKGLAQIDFDSYNLAKTAPNARN